MIIVLKPSATEEDINKIIKKIESFDLTPHISKGKERTIIGAIGDESNIRDYPLDSLPGVEKVLPILKPYKLVSRDFKSEDTLIDVEGLKIGGKQIHIVAGPCSVENKKLLIDIARTVKDAGANFLRGGAFKPRTSPYSFQGLGKKGLEYLMEAKDITGLKIVTEVMDPRDINIVSEYSDIIQIGARNMQNFRLLKEVGAIRKPVLLKRGLSATINEFLMSAEYIASEGNSNIILCERGIRTFENITRNTLDISAVPVIKKESHLPIFIDPSHAAGRWDIVGPLSKAAIAIGADGLMIEVHLHPEEALSDGSQSLKPKRFLDLMKDLERIATAISRSI
jgi:3-deoxy-7-phosphoheptulonate synthase